ncbi:hypothetical protein N0V90_009369 [Kalmusia sp. IMI 367209]|nr:hypothetical protein N0V90_009369 [Kalmusia sp. IMI 367209]
MSFLSLSNELLANCFACLGYHKDDIQSLRLVCKRFHANASPLLVRKAHIAFNRQSLEDLEALSNHPAFSKGINHITIDLSYYDELLAKSRRKFAEHNACDLSQDLEWMDRSMYSRKNENGNIKEAHEEINRALTEAYKAVDEWEKVLEDYDWLHCENSATEAQKLLITAHEEYVRMFDEQETVLGSEQGVKRLVQALDRMPVLKKISLGDQEQLRSIRGRFSYLETLSSEGLKKRCLRRGSWKGSFTTALETKPPVHIVSDLFAALAESSVRPTAFNFKISAPADMRCLNFSSAQLEAVSKVLDRAETLEIRVQSWARKGSLAENNDRPAEELAGLCALTRAFFSSPRLSHIEFGLHNYPCFYETPTISLSNLLPLPLSSVNISQIRFEAIPLKLSELKDIVESTKDTLQDLGMFSPYLLDGKWADGLDILRNLKILESITFNGPHGGEYGDRGDGPEIERTGREYILHIYDQNPLDGWTPEEEESAVSAASED